jgi:hypothetical protein
MTTRVLLGATGTIACVAALLAGSVTAAPDRPVPRSASNRRAARRDAELLLSRLRLPSEAVSSPTEPSNDGGHLKPSQSLNVTSARADAHAWWLVPAVTDSVLAYLKANPPAGSKLDGSESLYVDHKLIDQSLEFDWPPVRGVLGERELSVCVIALPAGRTGVLAQAQSGWIVRRPPSETIPATVDAVDLSSAVLNGPATVALTVTRAAEVRSLVSLLNAMPIVQPAVHSCPALIGNGATVITFSFRAVAGGPLLARATYVMSHTPASITTAAPVTRSS